MLLEQSCPWKGHIYGIEKEEKKKGLLKFVFFVDDRKMYRIQAVSVSADSFDNRVSIHKDYRGLRNDDLNKAAGITDGEFIHMAGFIGGAWSLESCIKIAEASLAQHEVDKKALGEKRKNEDSKQE